MQKILKYFNLNLTDIRNTIHLHMFGYPMKRFIQQIIEDTFAAKTDPSLRAIYYYFRNSKTAIYYTSPADRILFNFIRNKPYDSFVSEVPHYFLSAIKLKSIVYPLPDLSCFHPSDYKSGDIIIHKTKQSIECKTYSSLNFAKITYLSQQFGLNQTNSALSLSILYQNTDNLSFDSKEFLNSCLHLGFQFENIMLYSIKDLTSASQNPENFIEFFQLFNMSWFEYCKQHAVYIEESLNQIILFSQDQQSKKIAQKYLEKIANKKENETINLFSFKRPNNILTANDPLDTEIDQKNSSEEEKPQEPEEIFADIFDWFNEK